MSDDGRPLDERLDRIESTIANVTADHTGHLLALQSIAVVAIVRQMAAAEDPNAFLAECRKWAQSVIDSTASAPSLDPATADRMREVARRKIDGFFDGISVTRR